MRAVVWQPCGSLRCKADFFLYYRGKVLDQLRVASENGDHLIHLSCQVEPALISLRLALDKKRLCGVDRVQPLLQAVHETLQARQVASLAFKKRNPIFKLAGHAGNISDESGKGQAGSEWGGEQARCI